MKKMIVPVIMLAMFAFSNAHAQAPVTVKKGPAPVTKATPITVTKSPAILGTPAQTGKTTTTTTTKSTPAKTVTKTTTTTVAAPAHKPAAVKKTAAHPIAKAHAPAAKKPVARKVKRIAPPPPPMAPSAPMPPAPPMVQEEVVLPRPVAPVARYEDDRNERDMSNDRDEDRSYEKKDKCSSCHDLPAEQPWRFRNRHKFTYDYINSFYGKDGDCKKHCDDKNKHNDD